ncbi:MULTISPECIES: hypothetical protein [Streptomyces]|uniref:Nucleopolyhedrovirus P10 family protein n=1 Tax=Streptomyces xanthochromogenes TaxID=67384 RepID=A0ABQ3AC64_9ACTN|nr:MULTISPECIES: hypothetical protein [Streptomyces]GGY44514.1 hypothetical protein GCM10010326_43150 [Streptomyces xanthochromogenes]
MTGDAWSAAVRRRLGLGRLLALGGPQDGAWITERAAVAVLRAAAAGLPGLALTSLRLGPADPDDRARPLVPAPPSALEPVPLRVSAGLAALGGLPLPELTAALREVLFTTADERLGLDVSDVDLQVADLLDALPEPPDGGPPIGPAEPPATAAAAAALATPGVAHLTSELGAPVHEADGHVRVELATTGHPLEVARAVRSAVARAVPEAESVGVLVTWAGP